MSTYKALKELCDRHNVQLVAVSKTKPAEAILELYQAGQRDFGENYVQELLLKEAALPKDIRWHFIGHLQRNKVKVIAPFVHLIHAVDSMELLLEIQKQAARNNRVIDVLLQLHVAQEETKFGFDEKEFRNGLVQYKHEPERFSNIRIRGIMGMASFTENTEQVRREMQEIAVVFRQTKESFFKEAPWFDTCSMGMSGDYLVAIEEGSTLIRIGSMLFGARDYTEK